ncbi:MAG: pyrroloquinoline quinone biosynthesis protein PqqD [Betaproteobacteria bacterium TMED82]|nr:MAG: pyrroloquinoline quinone biosynthesis protein PqqD [Betaproteobacteria bacterium TMED82]|tara:strand:+ start:142 stop:423 length:282 start_codon:yes stop_codon:yes gene_type:complete
MFSDSTVFKLSKLFRLQWEPAQESHVLLYPEGMVKLNGSAGEILSRLDGVKPISEVVNEIEKKFNAADIRKDVFSFVEIALKQGWICEDEEGR